MEGDGTTCPKCKKGKLKTRQSKTGKLFLSCDNWRANDKKSCDYVQWGEDKVEPLEGHGVKCDKCGKGTMITKQAKGGRFLSCNTYPACDNAVFPESYQSSKPKGSGSPAFKGKSSSSSSGGANLPKRVGPALLPGRRPPNR